MSIVSKFASSLTGASARRSLASRPNYIALACLLFIAAASYVGLEAQSASSEQPANATSAMSNSTKQLLDVNKSMTENPEMSSNSNTNTGAHSADATNSIDSTVQVTVNGTTIDVPSNTTMTQTVPNADGTVLAMAAITAIVATVLIILLLK